TQTYAHDYRAVWRIFELMGRSNVAIDRRHPDEASRQTRQVPPAGTRKGALARGTLRHPFATSAIASVAALVARPLGDSGARGRRADGRGGVGDARPWVRVRGCKGGRRP